MSMSRTAVVVEVGRVGGVVVEVGADVTEDSGGEPHNENEHDGTDRDADNHTDGDGHCGVP